ncbi:hypothetical protein LCGC14_2163250, partial [marine sediment metagenome]
MLITVNRVKTYIIGNVSMTNTNRHMGTFANKKANYYGAMGVKSFYLRMTLIDMQKPNLVVIQDANCVSKRHI